MAGSGPFSGILPPPDGPPAPEAVLELWYRPPLSLDLAQDDRDVAQPELEPYRHHFGHVRFRVLLPDHRICLVEYNPRDAEDPEATVGSSAARRPWNWSAGRLTAQTWDPTTPGDHGVERLDRVEIPLTERQVELLLRTLDALFPAGPDSAVDDLSGYHPFLSNCATTLAGLLLPVLDGGGPRLPTQERLAWAFRTANSPATLWPRVRSWARLRARRLELPWDGLIAALALCAALGAVPGLAGCPADPDPDPTPDEPTPFVDEREPCASNNPLRDVFWGDLHAHTSWSFDAWVFDVRTTPEQAYRFAQGEPVALPPLGADGRGTQSLRLERPLDFAAVTDHAEYLAEVDGCIDPASELWNFPTCEDYRAGGNMAVATFGFKLTEVEPDRFDDICGTFGIDCLAEARPVWQRAQDAAEAAYDRTAACEFTSFVAYEYTAATGASNLHRNVLFRNATVPAQPAAYFENPYPHLLWDALERDCLDADGPCDVLAIPHNSNWSNGNLFAVEYEGAATPQEEAVAAARRAALEPLMEVYQHKGDSECSLGLSGILGQPDELCTFEKLRTPPLQDCGDGTGAGAMGGLGCISRADFLRGALLRGIEEEERIGANPLKLGVIASTDTHNGIPGAVEEDAYLGHWGNNEDLPERRLGTGALTPGGVLFSAGGLAAVWAEENSRDALFDALRRREVYGTSGPRITVRLFGGWDLDPALCDAADAVEQADAAGVPMGGDLAAPTGGARGGAGAGPSFFVLAQMDPGTAARPGTELERVQIVKGWVDPAGWRHVDVIDVAGVVGGGDAGVEWSTCAATGDDGAASLCAVWTDPDFDPAERAWYYARVVENPSCRWSTWACNALPAADRPPSCDDPEVPKTVQERAWTSPIWWSPETAGGG